MNYILHLDKQWTSKEITEIRSELWHEYNKYIHENTLNKEAAVKKDKNIPNAKKLFDELKPLNQKK